MRFQYACYSDVGMRENNEDSFGVREYAASLAALVADGVGGCANGEAASAMATQQILSSLDGKAVDEETLLDAIVEASDAICAADLNGYTTVAALWLGENQAIAANVGDSRVYQFRDGKIIYQSTDHSEVQMAVLLGELPPEATRIHPARNRIFRALGMPEDEPKVDTEILSISSGDWFLICSDGFWEPVWEIDMIRTLTQSESPRKWLSVMRGIVEAAADPAQDNHTAICIHVQ